MADKYIKIGVGFQYDDKGLKEATNAINKLHDNIERAINGNFSQSDLSKYIPVEKAKELTNILNKAFNQNLQSYNFKTIEEGIKKSNISAKELYGTFSKFGSGGVAAFEKVTMGIMSTERQLKKTSKILDEFATTFKNSAKWTVATGIVHGFTDEIQKSYGYVKSLDKSLNNIRIVTGKSSEDMAKFADYANKAAKSLGKTTQDFSDAALIYYQQGDSDTVAKQKASTTLKAANVTGQSADAVSEELTAVWNGFNVATGQTEAVVDKLAAVASTTASDLSELATGMSKVASSANSMGVDIDQLSAQISTIISVTRQAPESVGTALKTIYARMGDLEADGTDEFGVSLGEVSSQMKQMGINVLDETGQLKDMGDVIEEVSQKWSGWTREQKEAAAIAMAGKRQYNNLFALFENWDMYEGALKTSKESLGTLDKQNEIFKDSVQGRMNEMKASWEDFYDSILDVDTIKTGIGLFDELAKTATRISKSFGGGITAFAGLGSIGAGIFSKQLGQGFFNFSENRRKMNENENRDRYSNSAKALGMTDQTSQAYNYYVDSNANADLISVYSTEEEEKKIREKITEEAKRTLEYEQQRNSLINKELEEKVSIDERDYDDGDSERTYNTENLTIDELQGYLQSKIASGDGDFSSQEQIVKIIDDYLRNNRYDLDFNDETGLYKTESEDMSSDIVNMTDEEIEKELRILSSNITDFSEKIKEAEYEIARAEINEESVKKEKGRKKGGTYDILEENGDVTTYQWSEKNIKEKNKKNIKRQKKTAEDSKSEFEGKKKAAEDRKKKLENAKNNKAERERLQTAQKINDVLAETKKQLADQNEENQKILESKKEQLKKLEDMKNGAAVQKITADVAAFAASLSAVGQAYQIWADSDATFTDKLVSSIGLLITNLPILITLFEKVKNAQDLFGNSSKKIKILQDEINASEEKNMVLKGESEATSVKNNIVKKAEEKATQDLNKAKKEETEQELKSAGAKNVNTVATIKNAIQTELAAGKTIFAALASAARSLIDSLGVTAPLVGAALALVGVSAAVGTGMSYEKKARENKKENAEKISEEETSNREEIDNKLSGLDQIKQLNEDFKQGSLSLSDFKDKVYDLVNQYGLQDTAILSSVGNFDDLNNALKNTTKELTDEKIESLNKETKALKAAKLNDADVSKGKGYTIGNTYGFDVTFGGASETEKFLASKLDDIFKDKGVNVKGDWETGGELEFSKDEMPKVYEALQEFLSSDFSDDEMSSGFYNTITSQVSKMQDIGVDQISELEKQTKVLEAQKTIENQYEVKKGGEGELTQAELKELIKIGEESGIQSSDVLSFISNLGKEGSNAVKTYNDNQADKAKFKDVKSSQKEKSPSELAADFIKELYITTSEFDQNADETKEIKYKGAIGTINGTPLTVTEDDIAEATKNITKEQYDALINGNYDILKDLFKDIEFSNIVFDSIQQGKKGEKIISQDVLDDQAQQYLSALFGQFIDDDKKDIVKSGALYEKYTKLTGETLNENTKAEDLNKNALKEANELVYTENQIEQTKENISDIDAFIGKINESKQKGIALDNEDYTIIEDKYEILKNYNRDTDEYIDKLNEIKDVERENQIALKAQEEKTLQQNLKVDDSKFRGQMDEILNAEYEINVNIKADMQADFDEAVGKIEDIDKALGMIGEDYTVAAENIEEVGKAFHGALDDIQYMTDGTIQLNKEAVESAIASSKTELKERIQLAAADLELDRQMALAKADSLDAQAKAFEEFANTSMSIGDLQNKVNEAQEQEQVLFQKESLAAQLTNQNETTNAMSEDSKTMAENRLTAYQDIVKFSFEAAKAEVANSNNAANNKPPTISSIQSSISNNYKKGTSTDADLKDSFETTEGPKSEKDKELANYIATKLKKQAQAYRDSAYEAQGKIAELLGRQNQTDYNMDHTGDKKGSSKDPNQEDYLDDEIDKFHDLDKAIQRTESSYDRLADAEERAFGPDLMKNLNEQTKNLKAQVALQEKKKDLIIKEAAALQQLLADQGATFDSEGTITNYSKMLAQKEDEANAIIEQYNNMSAEEQEKNKQMIDDAKEAYETFQKNIEQYEEYIYDNLPDIQSAIEEKLTQQIELNIKKLNVKTDISMKIVESEDTFRKFRTEILKGLKEGMVGYSKSTLEGIRGMVGASVDNVKDSFESFSIVSQELEKMKNGGFSEIFGNNLAKAFEAYEQEEEKIREAMEKINEIEQEARETYLQIIEQLHDIIDLQSEAYNSLNDMYETLIEINDLTNGKDYGFDAEMYKKSLDNSKEVAKNIDKQMKLAKEELEQLDEGTEEYIEKKKYIADLEKQSIENVAEQLKMISKYTEALSNEAFEKMEKKVFGMDFEDYKDKWEQLKKSADRYFDTVERGYQLDKLERSFNKAISQSQLSEKAQRSLNQLREKELGSLKNKEKLSKYDVERAQKLLDIEMARIALEEAQNNKTSMKLKRDANGNYSYQYVADQNDISDKEQQLSDKQNDLYQLEKGEYRKQYEDALNAYSDYKSKTLKILSDTNLSKEERDKKAEDEYALLMEEYVNIFGDMNTARQNLNDDFFNDMRFNKTVDWYESMNSMSIDSQRTFDVLDEGHKQIMTNIGKEQIAIDELSKESGIDFKHMEDAVDEVTGSTHDLISETNILSTAYEKERGEAKKTLDEIKKVTDGYKDQKKEIIKVIDKSHQLYTNMQTDAKNAVGPISNAFKEIKINIDNYLSQAYSNAQKTLDDIISKADEAGKKVKEVGDKMNQLEDEQNEDNPTPTPTPPSLRFQKTIGTGDAYGFIDVNNNNKKYVIENTGTVRINSVDADKIIEYLNKNPDIFLNNYIDKKIIASKNNNGKITLSTPGTFHNFPKTIAQFDTGGYTGTWDSDGKLAMLHQKELVLNKEDTKNILDAVESVRNMQGTNINDLFSEMINILNKNTINTTNRILQSMQSLDSYKNTLLKLNNTKDKTNNIEQHVDIHADFPNVKDVKEIEDAFNNLTNRASQFIGADFNF